MTDWDENLTKDCITKGVKVMGLSTKFLVAGATLLWKNLMLTLREKKGKRALTQMSLMGGKLISSELKGTDLKVMNRIAKRYKVAFAAMKNPDGKSYTLFFKAQSEHQMAAALKAYLAETLKKEKEIPEQKEPLTDRLEQAAIKSRERSMGQAAEKTIQKELRR